MSPKVVIFDLKIIIKQLETMRSGFAGLIYVFLEQKKCYFPIFVKEKCQFTLKNEYCHLSKNVIF